jgi:hypothetical protein
MTQLAPPSVPRVPVTRVKHLDRPDGPDRWISLPAREAVLWCQARDMGLDDGTAVMILADRLYLYNGHWVCGSYSAKEDDGWPTTPAGRTPAKKSTTT